MAVVWLFDKARALVASIDNGSAIITTERYREHSEWSARFPESAYQLLASAEYAMVAADPELYLVEKVALSSGVERHVEVSGRSATALLSRRILAADASYTATAGAIIQLMLNIDGARALPLAVGSGTALGAPVSYTGGWKKCDEIALTVLAMRDLGMRCGLVGTTPTLDIFSAADTGKYLGEKYLVGSTARLIRDVSAWANYAYVHCKDSTGTRVQVEVDQTAGNDRREIYVSASVDPNGFVYQGFRDAMAAEGAAKLADTRKIEYAEADSMDVPLKAGDVVWYDAGSFAASFMATEVQSTYEGGGLRRTISFGERPATLKKTLRRLS